MEAGTVLASKYRLDSVLGRGGMGSVWRALHLGLNAPVAVKLMDPAIMNTPGMLQRFHREAQAAAQLRSPHVVQIIDHGVDTDTSTPFIAMELLEGESLADRLTRLGALTPREASRLVTEVCRALARAHDAGIVHRDLKPANLFLVANDDQEVTKVLDFGIAKAQLEQGLDTMTHSGSILGTPLYMSPEQIRGGKSVDGRSDLWSLAVVVCECLTGKRPFHADSIGALTLVICTEPVPQPSTLGPVPPGFDAWFERAVMREPELRFQTAREFAEELRRVCGGSVNEGTLWSTPPEAARARSSSVPEVPSTPQQFGKRRGPAQGPDGLPLAPTVDMKNAHTGDALATSSHDHQKVGSERSSVARSALALGLIAGLIGGVVVLGRAFSGASTPLRTSAGSALPAPEQAATTTATAIAPSNALPGHPAPNDVAANGSAAANDVAANGTTASSPPPPLSPPIAPKPKSAARAAVSSGIRASSAAPGASAAPKSLASSAAGGASGKPEITLESVIDHRR